MLSAPKDTYLQIVPVMLHSPGGKSCSTYALLDSGSQSTLLREDVAKQLNLKGKKSNVNITTIKDKSERLTLQEVSLNVSSRNNEHSLSIESAYVVPPNKFNMPAQPRPPNYKDSDLYTHLDGISLDEVRPEDIAILIGANVPEALLATDVRRGNKDQPLAVNTKFGWT